MSKGYLILVYKSGYTLPFSINYATEYSDFKQDDEHYLKIVFNDKEIMMKDWDFYNIYELVNINDEEYVWNLFKNLKDKMELKEEWG